MLPPFAREFTKSQIDRINKVYKTGGRLVIKPTRKQIEGGFLGPLASIGIPMAISLVSKMFGSGLQVDRAPSRNTTNVYVPPVTQGEGYYPPSYPYRPPPFFGTWENPIGMAVRGKPVKKKKVQGKPVQRKRNSTRKKQPIQLSSHIRSRPVNRHFVVKSLSNFDLMNWVEKLKIKHFRGIYSRDGLPRKIRKECGIIYLDDTVGVGTHWVCYRNLDSVVEYFDPFGLIMPNEAMKYFNTSGKHFTRSMKYKITVLFSVVTGVYIIYTSNSGVIVFYT